MEQKDEMENKKDKQVVKNGVEQETSKEEEAFWQKTLQTLAKEEISETAKFAENVSK